MLKVLDGLDRVVGGGIGFAIDAQIFHDDFRSILEELFLDFSSHLRRRVGSNSFNLFHKQKLVVLGYFLQQNYDHEPAVVELLDAVVADVVDGGALPPAAAGMPLRFLAPPPLSPLALDVLEWPSDFESFVESHQRSSCRPSPFQFDATNKGQNKGLCCKNIV